uniref:Large ribosomal subunit protein uL5c n=1 Tax=Apophlaea sinclairii TaxID=212746 RepID=A0A1C9CBW8_9FLOR|nr:ribosomal protein L5 [Apophlaea sinclairii]AOM65867.1 ribosomal protein L5 [Apophlaea sinclairii]
MIENIKQLYNLKVRKKLQQRFQYKNLHEIPKLIKITLNRGLGNDGSNNKLLHHNIKELAIISGQKPIITRAKNSIAGFKLREKAIVGLTLNLRKDRMYTFLEKLIHLTLPNIRDFRGVNKQSFDGHGNYNLGIKEQLIFPEITYKSINKIQGLNVGLVTTAKTDEEGFTLLKEIGIPFCK